MTQQTTRFAVHPAVTVREIGTEQRETCRFSLIERAAGCAHRPDAIGIITNALGFQDRRLAEAILSDPYRWSRVSRETRLMEIGEWLKAECFELLDLVSVGPISTIGD